MADGSNGKPKTELLDQLERLQEVCGRVPLRLYRNELTLRER
jgi:hypothetical protein